MKYVVTFTFSFFFIIIYFDRSHSHKTVRKEIQKLIKMKSKISLEKFDIECTNFTIGQKNLGFHYRKADLYFIEDALIIVGFYTLFRI
ncbi:hypothetical protein A9970_08305 [Sphingobacterium sp. UME9]|nr:hypothetical protein [Sphingobacterium sp. UME9]